MQDFRSPSNSPSPSEGFRSSPPAAEEPVAVSEIDPDSKHPGEEMEDALDEAEEVIPATDDLEKIANSQIKLSSSQADQAAPVAPDFQTQSEMPPSFPLSSTMGPPEVPSRSELSSQKTLQDENASSAKPALSSQPVKPFVDYDDANSDTTTDDQHDDEASELQSEPHDRIEDFDWDELRRRYHSKMNEITAKEHSILNEFSSLCEYFGVWAQASESHEVGRSYKRLKTQVAYVENRENELESKRQHYIKVVDAFKSALELLGT
ncbi:hypothetical protein KC319_g6731 [Hortaea werneckii]|nr:hypothetical protein KC323_g7888 [Hortaea werneckii]KAI7194101.1 hypothetical protein KC352_g21115 [Hortaea werneckii]KAI7345578.1 hypothetical protein KC320_g8274 [Hortaea werneckii]KAI7667196.1 hypothetical protein KC319_g6731 [Hortaea werneckii]